MALQGGARRCPLSFDGVHRTNYLLDERDFVLGEAVVGVEIVVRPLLRPLLHWDEAVDLARDVLTRLVEEDKEAR